VAAFCCNCREEFPVADPAAALRMGKLYRLEDFPERLASRFASWRGDDEGGYLCGNCYFDLTDDD